MPDELMVIPSAHRERLERINYPAVMTADHARRAADDKIFCQSMRLAVERAKAETLGPLRARLDTLRAQYDAALAAIKGAEERVQEALLSWRQRERDERARAHAAAATAQAALAEAEAVADAQAAGLSEQAADEIGVSVARTVQAQVAADIAPAPLPTAVAGEAGTASVRVTWTHEIEDFSLVPREYLRVDDVLVGAAVRNGVRFIPGVRIFQRETIVGRRRG